MSAPPLFIKAHLFYKGDYMKKRYLSNHTKGSINLDIMQECIYRYGTDDKILDILDLLILDYVNKRPLFINADKINHIELAYEEYNNHLYFELSFNEFSTYYPCAAELLNDDEFINRLYELSSCKLLDCIYLNDFKDMFRTTALYDELKGI